VQCAFINPEAYPNYFKYQAGMQVWRATEQANARERVLAAFARLDRGQTAYASHAKNAELLTHMAACGTYPCAIAPPDAQALMGDAIKLAISMTPVGRLLVAGVDGVEIYVAYKKDRTSDVLSKSTGVIGGHYVENAARSLNVAPGTAGRIGAVGGLIFEKAMKAQVPDPRCGLGRGC
jgi:hypothetical protein